MILDRGRVALAGAPLSGTAPSAWTPARIDGQAAWAKSYPVPIDPQFAQAWLQAELAAAAAVPHPAVLRPFGLWHAPDGALHLILERTAGRRWDEIVRVGQQRHGYLAARSWDAATQHVVREVAQAIQAGHFAGIAHANLAPDSVWVDLTPAGDLAVKVADFARGAPIVAGPRLRFAAPEQIDGGAIDARTDVFRLALLVYHALTGTVPWPDEDPAAARAARNTPADRVADERGQAAWALIARWPTVAQAIRAALDVDPRRRPATVAELLSRLGIGQALPPQEVRGGIDLGFAVAAAVGLLLAASVSLPAEDSKITRAMLDRQPLPACARQLPAIGRQICDRLGGAHANCVQAMTFLVAREECPNRVKQLQSCLEKP